MKFIDTHAHYSHKKFNEDGDELIQKLLNTDLEYIIECGTDVESNKRVLNLINKHNNMYGVIGFFPQMTHELENEKNLEEFISQLNHDKVVGIGEIGLDYYHKNNPKQQKKWFVKQLEIAKELNLPVCIHSRDAEEDTLEILKNFGEMNGVVHCFAYGVETMKELVKLGYYFGIGGTSTYKSNIELREAIKEMPLDRIVLETDCPYLSPNCVRKERNNSGNITYVIDEIAELKGIEQEEIIRISNENVRRLYPKMFN